MVGSLALNQRVWVRLLPPELLFDNAAQATWLGRQSADHPRSERGMLWVRLPPGPLTDMPWRTSPEWSPLSQGGNRGFESHPGYCKKAAQACPKAASAVGTGKS